jgi:nucleoside 2-deoxyribosyltransferase
LATVANLAEARVMADGLGLAVSVAGPLPTELGRMLLAAERAEVAIVKNGVEGATVVTAGRTDLVPSFVAPTVFPIGSGDVFSATFAALWAGRNSDPFEAARLASAATAHYCNTRVLPLPEDLAGIASQLRPAPNPRLDAGTARPAVYLAGPLVTLPHLWLLNEAKRCLLGQEVAVFSPIDEVGPLGADAPADEVRRVAEADLEGLNACRAVFAILDGLDPGTLFEVGHARSRGIPVVGYAESVPRSDLTMLLGTGCAVFDDFAKAIYHAGWEARRP